MRNVVGVGVDETRLHEGLPVRIPERLAMAGGTISPRYMTVTWW